MNTHKVISLLLFVLFIQDAASQVKPGGYEGNLVEEWVHSKTQGKLVLLDEVYITTKIIFTDEKIYFKKGSSNWLQNKWIFDKTETNELGRFDFYFDERNQQIIINYTNSELWYYHDYDIHNKNYNNLTVYKNLGESMSVVEELFPTQQETTLDSKRFRLDFNVISIYDVETKTWSNWEEGYNTFVINANDNQDIMHIKANGDEVLYRKLSGVEDKYTGEGEHYQILRALDDDGYSFRFQLFDNPSIGLKMIYGDIMIQFANH